MPDQPVPNYIDPLFGPARSWTPEAVGAPNIAGSVGNVLFRLANVERALSLTGRSQSPPRETARWGKEAPTVATSPPHRVETGGWIYEFAIDLRVAAVAGTTSVDLYYAVGAGTGTLIGTATIAAGNRQSLPVTIGGYLAASGDQLWVDATAIGSGCAGLGAYARMA